MKKAPSNEEITYLVPEINISVSSAWVALVKYCQENLPYGDIKIEINNSQPGKRLKETPNIRFDKQSKNNHSKEECYIIQSLDMRISKVWIDLVYWCQTSFNYGTLGFRVVNGQPTDLLSVDQKVDFSKPETIPIGMPLRFVKA